MNVWPADFVFDQLTTAFEASQHFARGEVVRRQTALIERLIRHADAQVPFYRDSKRLKPLFRADGAFDFAGWSDVPVLTRAEAQDNEEALRAQSVPPDVGPVEDSMTSGSTGMPLRFRRTALQSVASEALLNRIFRWHGAWPPRRLLLQGARGAGGPPGLRHRQDARRPQLRRTGRVPAPEAMSPTSSSRQASRSVGPRRRAGRVFRRSRRSSRLARC